VTLITPHFSLSEVACNDGTPYPPEWIESRLKPLLEAAEWVRERYGFPIKISSGYRTPWYNRKIGGAKFSQHVQGTALDMTTVQGRGKLKDLIQAVMDARINGYCSGVGIYNGFVHMDQRPGKAATWRGPRTEAQNRLA